VVVISKSHKAEWLEDASRHRSHWSQHFGHAPDVSNLHLEGYFDEVTFGERPRQLQQSTGLRQYLQPASGALPVAMADQGRYAVELNASSTMHRVGPGVVCHG